MGFVAAVIIDDTEFAALTEPHFRRFVLIMLLYLIPKVLKDGIHLRPQPSHFGISLLRAFLQLELLSAGRDKDIEMGAHHTDGRIIDRSATFLQSRLLALNNLLPPFLNRTHRIQQGQARGLFRETIKRQVLLLDFSALYRHQQHLDEMGNVHLGHLHAALHLMAVTRLGSQGHSILLAGRQQSVVGRLRTIKRLPVDETIAHDVDFIVVEQCLQRPQSGGIGLRESSIWHLGVGYR